MTSVLRPTVCLIAVLLLGTGCGSFINIGGELDIYGGVGIDLEYAANPPLPQDDVGWFWTFDLPFSFLLDTALLPVYGMATMFDVIGPMIDPDGDAKKDKDRKRAREGINRTPYAGSTKPSRGGPIRLKPRRGGSGTKINPLR